jgi:hypothetical protein
MGYTYRLNEYYKVKKNGEYPWPCPSEKDRNIELFTDDIFTKNENGTFMKETGLGCFGIVLQEDQVELIKKPIRLQII